MEEALFSESFDGFQSISSMPLVMREMMERELLWMSVSPVRVLESVSGDTYKAVVETVDGKRIETVLMKNARGHFTVCVSSQVGCAMACTFCATGTMGFTRNLLSDEIIDQYRFWIAFLKNKNSIGQTEESKYISNVVFMGMGEPLANYENVKEALRVILKYTDIGPTRITVSTVGLLPMLRHLLSDPEWPPVRLAVSLHSADSNTRKRMMPSSFDGFLDDLAAWADEYFKQFESKRRHLTFEYVMLAGVNDTTMHAEALIRFAHRIGKVRMNLIPYNFTPSTSSGQSGEYSGSLPGDFADFENKLRNAGVDATRRRSMGDDIAAACGQLIVEKNAA
jgi:adenine C2-methylase RlmN of 23S rRNA A2503 and tRNA A37